MHVMFFDVSPLCHLWPQCKQLSMHLFLYLFVYLILVYIEVEMLNWMIWIFFPNCISVTIKLPSCSTAKLMKKICNIWYIWILLHVIDDCAFRLLVIMHLLSVTDSISATWNLLSCWLHTYILVYLCMCTSKWVMSEFCCSSLYVGVSE